MYTSSILLSPNASLHKHSENIFDIESIACLPANIPYAEKFQGCRALSLFLSAQDITDPFYLVVNMLTGDLRRCLHFAVFNSADDPLMLLQKLWMTFLPLQILYPITVHLLPEIAQELNQPLVVRCHIDDVMECDICFGYNRNIVVSQNLLKILFRIFQILQPLCLHPLACKPNCQRFQ